MRPTDSRECLIRIYSRIDIAVITFTPWTAGSLQSERLAFNISLRLLCYLFSQ